MRRSPIPQSILLPSFLLAGLLCWSSSARPVQNWTDTALADQADLIVSATPASSQDEPADRSNPKPDSRVGVDTKFQVAAVFKRKLKKNELTMLHQRYFCGEKVAIEVIDGPGFVRFDQTAGTKYLLYLRRLDDGRFEPMSGQYDPHFSIKIIHEYADPPAHAVAK